MREGILSETEDFAKGGGKPYIAQLSCKRGDTLLSEAQVSCEEEGILYSAASVCENWMII